MYYPYLRGRQFELIALREYAQQRGDNNQIIPIIEPVKKTFNSLKLAIPRLIAGEVKFALILNPQVGEIEDSSHITESLSIELENKDNWIPTFIVTNNILAIRTAIHSNGYENVMLICSDMLDTSSEHFEALAKSDQVKYIVSNNRTLKRTLRGHNKFFIRIDDKFEAQKRNSDYLEIPEQKFTEEHLFFGEDGYQGFSDYTVLTSDFKEGGATPYAVSIHLTYQKANEEIWIRHFTSESNFGRENIQGKFAEAARKAVHFLDEENIENNASNELRDYYNQEKYPGLGMVKKITIKNHLELINSIL
ncbi:hypothetical protein BZG02_12260 [Labilibaculum filiforme]|uniref:Sce7725 family protein n=1 Tax=Labilibaculum filiforme TaxID=1940526 RepID=A0A2N3HWT4_9BACT|nr:sce7725 family protein [Labilibaculum filiforme]PKQ62493.1 hypothetical protein BZG02_12260 [Labilibaculum filiforme]